MYCVFCGAQVQEIFSFCRECGERLSQTNDTSSRTAQASSELSAPVNTANVNVRKRELGTSSSAPVDLFEPAKRRDRQRSSLPTYQQHFALIFEERQSNFKVTRKLAKTFEATINIALMEYILSELKPVRGSSLPLKIPTNASYIEILNAAIAKREAFDRRFPAERGYVLAYQDASIAKTIPATDENFVLKNYKEWLGKPYSRITLYLSPTGPHKQGGSACINMAEIQTDEDQSWSDIEVDYEYQNVDMADEEIDIPKNAPTTSSTFVSETESPLA